MSLFSFHGLFSEDKSRNSEKSQNMRLQVNGWVSDDTAPLDIFSFI